MARKQARCLSVKFLAQLARLDGLGRKYCLLPGKVTDTPKCLNMFEQSACETMMHLHTRCSIDATHANVRNQPLGMR